MKKIYFVDLENVAHHFLAMAERLTTEDQIIIFMRHRHHGQPDMRSSLEKAISKFKDCKISYKIVDMKSDEKNAMDFQICTTLGYMVGLYEAMAEYYIISNDKGYYAAKECVLSSLCENAKIDFIKDFSNVAENLSVKEELKQILPTAPKKVLNIVASLFEKTNSLNEWNNALQAARLKQETIEQIFHTTRLWYCGKKGIKTPEEKYEAYLERKKRSSTDK